MLQQYKNEFKAGKFQTPLCAMEYDVFTDGFIDRHTKPELLMILAHLYDHQKFGKGMGKKRMVAHIKFWFALHGRGKWEV